MEIVPILIVLISISSGFITGFGLGYLFCKWIRQRRLGRIDIKYGEVDHEAINILWDQMFDGDKEERKTKR